jgi:glycosyltransferase 2 family protein
VSDLVRRHGGLLLRVVVSVLLLGVVLAYVDVAEMARTVRDGEWAWFLVAVAVMSAAAVVGALRWRVFLLGAEIPVSRLRASRVFAASLVLNNVLPTSVGGDALRAWLVGRDTGRLLGAATATIVDKVTALLCLFALGWLLLAVDGSSVPSSVVGVFAWVTVGLVVAVAAAALVAAGVGPVLHRVPERFAGAVREIWATVRVWAGSGRLVAAVTGLGLMYQVLAVLALVAVAKTVGVELSFALAAVSAAIVLVAMLVPVSIGGLGVREGGFVLLLGQADVDGAQATLVSLLGAGAVVLGSAAVVGLAAAIEALRARETEKPTAQQERPAPGA